MTASHDPSAPAATDSDPKKGSLRALRAVNFFIADVQNGMGPYMALFLQSSVGWGPAQIGSALAAGNIAQVVAQTPAGALIDNLRQKRTLLIVSIALIMTGMLGTAFFTVRPVVMGGQAALAARGVLYRLSHHPAALIAVQCLDGLGAGIFGVVGVLIIADLTKGTGRFNAAQGAIATAQGIGAFLSNSVAGYLAKTRGDDFAFYVLASIAAVGLVFFWVLMPETRGQQAPAPAAA